RATLVHPLALAARASARGRDQLRRTGDLPGDLEAGTQAQRRPPARAGRMTPGGRGPEGRPVRPGFKGRATCAARPGKPRPWTGAPGQPRIGPEGLPTK